MLQDQSRRQVLKNQSLTETWELGGGDIQLASRGLQTKTGKSVRIVVPSPSLNF